MLQPKLLPEIIKQVNSDGVKTTILLTTDGSLLASAGDTKDDKLIAAIVSSIWVSYEHTGKNHFENETLNCVLLDCQHGRLAVIGICGNDSQQFIACLCAEPSVEFGMLRAKAKTLSSYLEAPFKKILSA
eukprot:GEZU01036339.1.p1 GENE.GEZU01036339.1~~GEZU01036339.1.p1  ORF type:complete len:137 (-),score=25.04 GEZU01036339.1:139-528(-)